MGVMTAASTSIASRVLAREQWQRLAAAHEARIDAITAGRRDRAARGETHAIEDFLYDYYSTKPSQLRRWHPGVGVVLEGADNHAGWRWYTADAAGTRVDADAFWDARQAPVEFVESLMHKTAARPMQLGCFGMHEWAMVYQSDDTERRHGLPLRLGRHGTDAVVESHPLQCTHFDAFRFFTPPAMPLNRTELSRHTQIDMEQPGCLHASMDLFKWCAKLAPAIPSDLQMDCFELALEVRRVDMQASPYDVSRYGLAPIAVETPQGKRDYAARQREFAVRARVLRERIVGACEAIRETAGA